MDAAFGPTGPTEALWRAVLAPRLADRLGEREWMILEHGPADHDLGDRERFGIRLVHQPARHRRRHELVGGNPGMACQRDAEHLEGESPAGPRGRR